VGTHVRVDKQIQTWDLKEEPKFGTDTSPALVEFLKQHGPTIEEQLERNLYSRAFDNYVVSWEEEIHNITRAYELSPSPDFNAAASEESVTCLSWNCSGSMLAASYGKMDHSGWCAHTGSVNTWNVFRRKMDPKKPEFSLETSKCCCQLTRY
jgi:WD repeat-containing protein 34